MPIRDSLPHRASFGSVPWRSSPVGEMFANAGLAHALLTCGFWASAESPRFVSVILAASTIAALQCIGLLRAPLLSIVLPLAAAAVLTTCQPNEAPDWLADGPFSTTALAINLAAFSAIRTLHESLAAFGAMAPRQQRAVIGWVLGALFVGYMIVFPAVSSLLPGKESGRMSRELGDSSLSELVQLHVMETFFALFFFAIGATIGSFLNVVAYRLPLGRSVVARASRCPTCDLPIAPRDNLPVIGWLLLDGRCRTCQQPISPRYPLVEFSVGAIFLLLYFVELISGGLNIPVREPNAYAGVVWILMYTKWDLVALYAYHCLMFCILVAWTLIAFDRNPIPKRSLVVALLMAAIPPILLPTLLPMASLHPWAGRGALSSVIELSLGCAAGFAAGQLLAWGGRLAGAGASLGVAAACTLIGAMLGWQAVLVISGLASILFLIARRMQKPTLVQPAPPLIASLLLATLMHHAAWRWITGRILGRRWESFDFAQPVVLIAAAGLGLAAAAIIRRSRLQLPERLPRPSLLSCNSPEPASTAE